MIQLDGIEYSVKTPSENTDDLITYINNYCLENDIRNSLGEVIQIDSNTTNPLYMLCFGMGYMTTILEKLTYSAGCSMSIAEASERQLLNLADIAGIKRSAPTKTTITGTVYANIQDAGAVPCVITQQDTCTIIISGMEVSFHPAFDLTVPIDEARQIVLIADEYGSYDISPNTIVEFDEPIPGFRSMTTLASVPGQSEEKLSTFRARLQRRTVEGTQVDRAATAIQNLEGVAMCNIYFNYSPQQTIYVGSRAVPVAPRTALILVQGFSNDIARTFYRYMFCATSGQDVTGAVEQVYTTHAGQDLPIYIIPPVLTPVYVRIFIKNSLSYEQIDGIKDLICSLAGTITIGQSLTSVDVINAVASVYTNLTVQGAEISKDNVSFNYIQKPDEDAVFIFNVKNMTVVEV